MSAASSLKGKGRASADSAEPSRAQSPSLAKSLRHGRGPIVPEEDDIHPHDQSTITADETAPLLQTTNSASAEEAFRSGPRRRSAWARCCLISTCTTSFVLMIVIVLLYVWIGRIVSEESALLDRPEQLLARAVRVEGPFNVAFGSGDKNSEMTTKLDFNLAVDLRRGLGWDRKEAKGASILRQWEATFARTFVRQARSVTVHIGDLAVFDGRTNGDTPLVWIGRLAPVTVPLSYPRRGEQAQLTAFSVEVPFSFPRPEDLAKFGQRVWDKKEYNVGVNAGSVRVNVGEKGTKGPIGWILRRWGTLRGDIREFVQGQVPDMPGSGDPSSLVKLLEYSIKPSDSRSAVALTARARLTNPVQSGPLANLNWHLPFRLPFTVSIPVPTSLQLEHNQLSAGPPPPVTPMTDVLLAKVFVEPFGFSPGQRSSIISLEGELVRAGNLTAPTTLPDDPAAQLKLALSRFAARYMAGLPNTVLVRYDVHPDPVPKNGTIGTPSVPFPPPFVGELAKKVVVPLTFPGSEGSTDVFKDLRIEDMKIKLSSMAHLKQRLLPAHETEGAWDGNDEEEEPEGDLLCSGRVVGELALPVQFLELSAAVDVNAIWPDVLVYDGALPDPSAEVGPRQGDSREEADQLAFSPPAALPFEEPTTAPEYPPNPVPRNAFARLHPSSLIPAVTTHVPANATSPSRTFVSATFTDAPLYILEDRTSVFQHFVGQILFGSKAKAGVRGVSEVELALGGWGEVKLEGLPLEAEFTVGGLRSDPVPDHKLRQRLASLIGPLRGLVTWEEDGWPQSPLPPPVSPQLADLHSRLSAFNLRSEEIPLRGNPFAVRDVHVVMAALEAALMRLWGWRPQKDELLFEFQENLDILELSVLKDILNGITDQVGRLESVWPPNSNGSTYEFRVKIVD